MPRTPVIRDVNHPEFPHGTTAGVHRGCDCIPCKKAHNKAKKANQVNRARGIMSRVPIPPTLIAHIDKLKEAVPGSSNSAISRAAGLSESTISRAINEPDVRIWQSSIDSIMSLTPAKLAEHCSFVVAAPYIAKIRQMEALGWSIEWQGEQMGTQSLLNILHRNAEFMQLKTVRRIEKLYKQVGDKLATKDQYAKRSAICQTRKAAMNHGYYPPAAYDDDGNVNLRFLPDHPWAKADVKASERIEILELLLMGFNFVEVAGKLDGNGGRRMEAKHYDTVLQRVVRLAAAINWETLTGDAKNVLRHQIDTEEDRTKLALDLGLISPRSVKGDHPALVQWKAENA